MKPHLFFAAAILSISSIRAAYGQDTVKITGRIDNRMSDTLKIKYNTSKIAYFPTEITLVTDNKGHFATAFNLPAHEFTAVELYHGSHIAELLLQPGDSLSLRADCSRFDSSITYSGRGAAASNFVALHTITMGRMNQYSVRVREAINKEPDGFLPAIDAEKKKEYDFLERHKKGLPDNFIKYWRSFYEYYNYFFTEQYPQVHQMLKVRHISDTIPDTNYTVLSGLPIKLHDDLLQLPPYLLYLTGLYETKLKAAGYTFPLKDTLLARRFQDSVNHLVALNFPARSAEFYFAQQLYGNLRAQPLWVSHRDYTYFTARWPNSTYLPPIDKQLAIAERLAPGMPAPDITVTTEAGKTVKLSDLKGKVVYIDFWAGWCKQCVGELVRGQKMKVLFKDKPVEFVNLSLNEDTTMDNGLIRKYKLEGGFKTLTGGWSSEEIQQFAVQSIPAYYLIDADGKIALQHAPSPMQSTQLSLEIGKLLK